MRRCAINNAAWTNATAAVSCAATAFPLLDGVGLLLLPSLGGRPVCLRSIRFFDGRVFVSAVKLTPPPPLDASAPALTLTGVPRSWITGPTGNFSRALAMPFLGHGGRP